MDITKKSHIPNGLVFDIQSHSIHDGPGCRTTVFMMGCSLRCIWCANPEGQEKKERLLYRKNKCAGKDCVRCIEACPHKALKKDLDGHLIIKWDCCSSCTGFKCTGECFYESLVKCGKYLTSEELMKILNRDRYYWGDAGGVTFSGGEPLAQKDFLLPVLKNCKESFIHTAIETSCYTGTEDFLEIMNYIDFAFADIKHMNSIKHREYTCVNNDLILNNIKSLCKSRWPGKLVIRMPVIEGFNDNEENIINTAEFMKNLSLGEINILSFNPLGESKWRQCGMNYLYKDCSITGQDMMNKIKDLFSDKGIVCYIDYDTPW
ncbi:MAG: 4-hydroxyphenylacetate decarboxylase activase [Candidatus Eremiobacterota bacterium]